MQRPESPLSLAEVRRMCKTFWCRIVPFEVILSKGEVQGDRGVLKESTMTGKILSNLSTLPVKFGFVPNPQIADQLIVLDHVTVPRIQKARRPSIAIAVQIGSHIRGVGSLEILFE